jgi:hypothetical protein
MHYKLSKSSRLITLSSGLPNKNHKNKPLYAGKNINFDPIK